MARCRTHVNPVLVTRRFLLSLTVAALCVQMAAPGELVAAAAGGAKGTRQAVREPQIAREQKTLHALNRLTFGPRPGEVALVDRMGLEAWFQQQLHPEQISDTALDGRLDKYPAMRLSQAALVERFPTPEMLRRYSRGSLIAPDNDLERVIYADAALNYEEKVEAKRKKGEQPLVTVYPGAAGTMGQVTTEHSAAASLTASRDALGVGSQTGSVAPVIRRSPAGGETAPGMQPMEGAANTEAAAMPVATRSELMRQSPDVRWQRLVAMSPEEMQSLHVALKGGEQERLFAGLTPEQVEEITAMKSPERLVTSEVLSERLLRDVYSERQLQAVMVDFWLNHFSVFLHKNQNEPYLLPAYEREAVLPHALGKFEDLLVATAESPAMLVYLDNWESVGPESGAAQRAAAVEARRLGALPKKPSKMPQGINENYARELMELHTLGVKGGYTQQDVIEVAKCFTGWTIDRPAQGGEFLFNPNRHEPGDKTVLGHVIHEDGMNEGLAVLHLLATSPATAHFVSLKLAERFVSDQPPAPLVNRMTATFLKTDGDLKAVLTTMFHSPEFWSPQAYRAKVKTPVEFVASALRASGADVKNPVPMVQALDRLGMPIYGMQTPNGYSWQADAWVSSNALLTRMNFALVLAGGRLPGTVIDWEALLGADSGAAAAMTDEVVEARLEHVLLDQPAAEQTHEAAVAGAKVPDVQQQAEQSFRATPVRSAELRQAGSGGMLRVKAGRAPMEAVPETPLATMAGLLLGSPDFQRR